MNAAIVIIVWLGPVIQPFHRHRRFNCGWVIREAAITQTNGFDSLVFGIRYTQMFVTPNPSVDLFGVEEGPNFVFQFAGVCYLVRRKKLVV